MCFTRISTFLTAILIWIAVPASGFDIEVRQVFPAKSETAQLNIISTADLGAFRPIILKFQAQNPGVTVDYTIASSTELMKAIYQENARFDLAISSAMDLQTKIANDGLAKTFTSQQTDDLPDWAKWRNQVFAFTQEPAVLVVSDAFFPTDNTPASRDELIELLRENPERFLGRAGTYDVRTSGLGYLFATQDSRSSESFWRLTEIMGRLDSKLYCCSSQMISDVASGKLAFAYNVLGSYAASRLPYTKGFRIVELEDFLSVMLRTVLIPTNAENDGTARLMVNFLVTLNEKPELVRASGLPPISDAELQSNNALRPIRLGPGLLVFLDRLKRENFISSWANSIEQD